MILHLTLPIFLGALLLQTNVLLSIGPAHLRPDLLVLFVIGIGVICGVGRAIVWAAIAGLLMDMVSAGPTGAHTLALLPIALVTLLREADIIEGRLTLALVLAFLAAFVYDGAFLAVLQLTGRRVEWLPSLLWVMLPGAVLNIAVMPLVFWLVKAAALPSLRRTPAFSTA